MGFWRDLFWGPSKPRHAPPDEIHIDGDGCYEYDIVGEAHCQDSLDRICGGKSLEGHEKEAIAQLVIEPGNRYDPNAVAVFIDGERVGYLAKSEAKDWSAIIARAGAKHTKITCRALIVGGWKRPNGNEGHYGVKLDLEE